MMGTLIHRVRLVLADGGWVAECSCGWESEMMERSIDAEQAWNDHTGAWDVDEQGR